MKKLNVEKKWVLAALTATAITALAVGCQQAQPPSNLGISNRDAQQAQNDELHKTDETHQVVIQIEEALTPVESVLKDLSNVTSKIDASVGGKSIDQLQVVDVFSAVRSMLSQASRSPLVKTDSSGKWSIDGSVAWGSQIFHVAQCNSADFELSGYRDGDHDNMELDMIECDQARIDVADIQVNKNTLSLGLHLENLNDLSISSPVKAAACSLSIGLSTGVVISSTVSCAPINIQVASNRVEISPLTLKADMKGNLSGSIGVHGYDSNGNEIFAAGFPKGVTATASPSAAPTDVAPTDAAPTNVAPTNAVPTAVPSVAPTQSAPTAAPSPVSSDDGDFSNPNWP